MDYVWLVILTGVAIDFAVRIVVYARTKNEKAKHQHFWWIDEVKHDR